MNALVLLSTAGCDIGTHAPGQPESASVIAAMPDQAAALTPLAEYSSEVLGGLVVLWHPDFRTRGGLQGSVRDNLEYELSTASPATRDAIAGVRVAVAVESPGARAVGIRSGGHGVSWHRSAQWLEEHGIDAARESVVEIWNAQEFVDHSTAQPGAFVETLRDAADDGICRLGHGPENLDQMASEDLGAFKVLWSPRFDSRAELRESVRAALTADITETWSLISPDARSTLTGTRIIVNPSNCSPDGARLRGAAFHVSAEWLSSHGYDPRREGAVEVHDAREYLHDRGADQPLVLLHELTHAMTFHASGDVVEQLTSAYESALSSGKYDDVQHASPGQRGRAYALKSRDEYAAELSEAYLGKNDWYPFTRADLTPFDPAGEAVVEAVWRQR